METGEIPVQCRCCVGGVFFIMPLEQLFREGGESEDAQVRIQALNVSDSLRSHSTTDHISQVQNTDFVYR